MQRAYYYTCLLLMILSLSTSAQTQSEKLSVFIEISDFSDSTVTLAWESHNRIATTLSRKKISDDSWTTLATNYQDSTYTDTSIETNIEYEYQFLVSNTSNSSIASGYIAFGSNIAAKGNRGTLLLVVDDRFTTMIKDELTQLQQDAISDGYTPKILTVSTAESTNSVKSKIDQEHATSPLSGIYLIGHVPVPRSGIIAPDGHGDHRGAWSTDLYYVSNASEWTDNAINYTNTSDTALSNIPGDGKYDASSLTSKTICPISRIDFYDLPSQENTELQMLKNYLTEASKYKRGKLDVKEAGLIDNQLVNFYEGFAGNGYRNFKSLMGDSISTGSMLNHLETNTYKWTYTCSFGADTNIHNVASVSQLKNSTYKGIFSMVMGSYFGDWDSKDNIMRSLLADGKMLTTCWAGRPNWFVHHMGLNNPIGLSAKMTAENGTGRSILNTTSYDAVGLSQNGIHVSLLGDLTLRQNYLPQIADFSAEYKKDQNRTILSWETPAAQSISTIDVYKSNDATTGYTLLATLSATDTAYIDSNITDIHHYYVKYTKLDTTLSGSYFNNSLGSFIRIDTAASGITIGTVPAELISFTATKSGDNGLLRWTTATEENVSHFDIQRSSDLANWETIGHVSAEGNSNSNKYYEFTDFNLSAGDNYYRLKTIDFDGHTELSQTEVLENEVSNEITIYPNPTTNNTIHFDAGRTLSVSEYADIEARDLNGNSVFIIINPASNTISLDARKGIYYVKILGNTQRVVIL